MELKNICKKCSLRLKGIGLLFILSLLSLQAVYSQDFSSIDMDLQALENLINDTIASTLEQQKLLEDLRESLNESGNLIASYESIITEQENLLRDLRIQLSEMSETFRMQSALSARYERTSKYYRTFMLLAVPITAIISGSIVWILR